MNERVRPQSPLWARLILASVLGLLYLPLLVMIINSVLIKNQEGWSLTLSWYREIFSDREILDAVERSFFVSVSSAFIATLIGTAASVAVNRSAFRLRLPLEVMSFVSLIVPELVFALALLSWFFVLHIPLSLYTVIIAHVTFSLSFVILTVGARLTSMDPSVEDAARDLGASEYKILFSVTLPLLAPAIGAAFVLSLLLSFDDFLITYFTNGVGSDTLPIKLYGALKMGITPKLSALSTLMFLFTLLLILFGLRGRALRDVTGLRSRDP